MKLFQGGAQGNPLDVLQRGESDVKTIVSEQNLC